MFSVHEAASIYYYLAMEEGADPEKILLSDSNDMSGKSIYYDPIAESDPLAVQATWAGNLADAVGFKSGSNVSKSGLAAMWFGIDPADGKTPLSKSGPSIKEQVTAQAAIAKAEQSLFNASNQLLRIQKGLEEAGHDYKQILANQLISRQKSKVTAASKALTKAKQCKANRANAHDCTFSAPKSVSVYWARLKTDGTQGDPSSANKALELERAMIESARSVIENYLEPQLLFTRHRKKNEMTFENVKGIAAALFVHFDARPTQEEILDPTAPGGKRTVTVLPDPQMHVHGLLMSMAMDFDDDVRALWTTFLGSHAKAIGAAFRGELAHRLRKQGLDIRQDQQDNILGFDLAGVSDSVINQFSARRAQVKEHLDDGLDSESAAMAGRETKNDYTGEQLLESWRARLDGLGLISDTIAQTTNDSLARESANEAMRIKEADGSIDCAPDSDRWTQIFERERQSALSRIVGKLPTVEEAVANLLSMDSQITLLDISRLAFEASQFCTDQLTGDQTPLQWAEQFKIRILMHPDLKVIHGTDRYGRPAFTSDSLVKREDQAYYENIPQLLEVRSDLLDDAAVQEAIDQYEKDQWIKLGQSFSLKGFQKDIVHGIARCKSSIHIVLAPAGCGKTTAVSAAVIALEAASCNIFCLAPSNRAAQKLAGELNKPSESGISPQRLLSRIRRNKVTLTSNDVLLVDEASMLDFDTAAALVKEALNAKGGPARLVLIGDTEQLPAVGRGNFFRKLAERNDFISNGDPGPRTLTRSVVSMDDWSNITRQHDDIAKQATALFALGETAKALEIYERMGAVSLLSTREEVVEKLVGDAFERMDGLARDLISAINLRESRHLAFAAKAHAALGKLTHSDQNIHTADAFIQCFDEIDRADAKQWLDDKAVLERARGAVSQAFSSTMMLATKRVDVAALNSSARSRLKSIGLLGGSNGNSHCSIPRGKVGQFEIAQGERIIFNSNAMGTDEMAPPKSKARKSVSKALIGTVLRMAADGTGHHNLTIELDNKGPDSKIQRVVVNTANFSDFDYAYALTVHKSQGETYDRVFEMVGGFAAKQTDYVSKSRFRSGHKIYAVESEYELYKSRAQEAIEKFDASDRGFAVIDLGLDEAQLAKLDREISKRHVDHEKLHLELTNSRLRAIAQGILIDFGIDPNQPSSSEPVGIAKIQVDGKTYDYRGPGLMDALKQIDAKQGDHIGIEALSLPNANGETIQWRCYTRGELDNAGLLRDDAGRLAAENVRMAARSSAASNAVSTAMQENGRAALISEPDARALFQKAMAQAAELSAQLVSENSKLVQFGKKAKLPVDLNLRTRRASEILSMAKPKMRDQVLAALAAGIHVSPYAAPTSSGQREWLGQDNDLAYCLTLRGSIEAWGKSSLPMIDKNKLNANVESIDQLYQRRADIHSQVRSRLIAPIKEAFSQLADSVEFPIVEHSEHGLCIGVSAADGVSISRDPNLTRLFINDGGHTADHDSAAGAIANLKQHKGYDSLNQLWMIPVGVDDKGFPTVKQPAINELINLGGILGLGPKILSPEQVARDEAWDAIQSRLQSPWGYGYAFSMNLSPRVKDPRNVLDVFQKKSDDIVRWDAPISEGSKTQEWQLCSTKSDTSVALPSGKRQLRGLIVHANERDIFMIRDQRIVAIERNHLNLHNVPTDSLIGNRVTVEFTDKASPKLLAQEIPTIFKTSAGLIKELEATDGDLSALLERLKSEAQQIAWQALSNVPNPLPNDYGMALAWGAHERADELQLIRMTKLISDRSFGMNFAGKVLAIEQFNGSSPSLTNAFIEEVGTQGVLIKSAEGRWLVELQSATAIFGKFRVGQKFVKVTLTHKNDDISLGSTGAEQGATQGG